MRFADPYFLLLLGLIPLFFFYWKKRNVPPFLFYPLPVPREVLSRYPIFFKMFFRCLVFILVVVALARPQSSYRQMERQVSGVDIILTMDVSLSMEIEDMSNRSRLDVAKQTIEDFIRERSSDRIGFVIFSGEPLTLAPPTLDYGLVLSQVRKARTDLLRDGTAIGDGLALAVNRLKDSRAKSRVIILLTDGESNIGQVDPLTAGDLAAGFGIKVYTIAIGKEGRVKVPIRQKGIAGNVITHYQWFDNSLNTDLLQKISERSHGRFYRVQDENTLNQVFSSINELEKTDIKANEKIHYDEIFFKPLQLAFLIILFDQLVSLFWRRMWV